MSKAAGSIAEASANFPFPVKKVLSVSIPPSNGVTNHAVTWDLTRVRMGYVAGPNNYWVTPENAAAFTVFVIAIK